MRHFRLILTSVLLMAIAVAATPVFAENNTATANAGATVQAALQIVNDRNLAFGTIAVSGGDVDNSRVIITPGGNRSVEGDEGSTALLAGGTVSSARFLLSGGSSNESFAISIPSSILITKSGGGPTMVVDAFTSNPSVNGTLSGGAKTLTVGATLNVTPNQASGLYTGTFQVSVYYN